jgi:ADP-ribose pyrophosphatase YjhB (NUDIX family)
MEEKDPQAQKQWLDWAVELQFLAQVGLAYSRDPYDQERFQRVRDIAAEMMSCQTGCDLEFVKEVFCNETGFQTPKLDTRAAIFQQDKILLVKEKNGTWALPGGWCDVNQSILTNTVKEVKEEAGLDVEAVRLIACQDRNKHNVPRYAYGICKVFVQCRVLGGEFHENLETVACGYFGLDELPKLALDKTTPEQIALCFEAHQAPVWETRFE